MAPAKKLDAAIHMLRWQIARLAGTEDRPQARKNGRTRALTALRRVRAALDETYPNIVVTRARNPLKTARGKLDRLKRAGWKEINDHRAIAQFAAAGVRVKHVEIKHGMAGKSPVTRSYWYIPAWAKAIGPDRSTALREAKKSKKLRDAALAAEALR